jgi:hypothetical protein
MAWITDWSCGHGFTGQATIGATAVQLSSTSTPLARGVIVKIDGANSGYVCVGFSAGVTTSTGFKMSPDELEDIDIDDLSKLWLIGSAAGQVISWRAR